MSVSWIEVVSLVILHSIIVMAKQKTTNEQTAQKVDCLRCCYSWGYKGNSPKSRVRCPHCHSAQNDYNRELFGLWRPTQ